MGPDRNNSALCHAIYPGTCCYIRNDNPRDFWNVFQCLGGSITVYHRCVYCILDSILYFQEKFIKRMVNLSENILSSDFDLLHSYDD